LKRLFFSLLFALALMLAWRWDHRPITTPPGVLVAETPVQAGTERPVFMHGDFSLTPRAHFELRARVLASERYRLDAGARLAPIDLALGWGPMSDQVILDRLEIRQGGRWYYVSWDQDLPLDEHQLFRSSANMHMVPADDWVEDRLRDARPGQVLRLRGLLVDASRDDGWSWKTSLSRDDTGGGSCELVYVEDVQLEPAS
jgi:hypothetical protein